MPALQDLHFDLDGVAFAFAALGEPGGEAFGETLGGQAETGFQAAIGKGQGVVEIGGVREIAHRELIEPFERTGTTLPLDQYINLKFLGVHGIKNNIRRLSSKLIAKRSLNSMKNRRE
jgi:hypothetical protein